MNIVAIRPAPLGDSLLVFPILAALRTKYTNSHITFLGSPAVLPLAKAWGLADAAIDPADVQWHELVSLAGIHSPALRDLLVEADLIICWLDDSDGWVKNALLAIGVKNYIIAPEREALNGTKHIVEQLAEPLDLPPLGTGFVAPSGKGKGFCSYNAPIAIHPGSSDEGRRWPAASFAAVINQLLRLQQPVLLLAGPSETEVLKEVQKRLSYSPKAGLLTILQNVPLLEVVQQLRQCRGFLGNDSGISHLAGMLGIPTLVLFGWSNPLTKHPVGPFVETLQAQPMKRLKVEKVLNNLLQMSQLQEV
jgi:heptosyltransferase III